MLHRNRRAAGTVGAGSAAALLALVGSGTAAVAQSCTHTPADSLAVVAVAAGIIDADNARDLERVLTYYAPDAVLHPPGEGPVTGRDAIRPRYEGLFRDFDPAIESEIDEVSICGRLAAVSGRNRGVLRPRLGGPERTLDDAWIMTLEPTDGSWRITQLIWHPASTPRAGAANRRGAQAS
jgi:uncharacterized protein (TIGR02246 family)